MSSNRTSLKVRASQAAVVASLAVFMIGATASAADAKAPKPPRGGGVSPADCSSQGGGTWCQGEYWDGLKECYSNYEHPTNYHSSTAILGALVDKEYADAGYWDYAQVSAGFAYTCYTYWNNQA
jgi:lactococcin 972 family bacteriocin